MAALLVRCVIVAHRAPRRRRSSSRSPSCSGARSPSRLRRRCRRRRRRRRRRLEGVVLDTGGAPCTGGSLYKVPAVPMPAAAVGAAVAPTDLALEGGALARAVPALGLERARRPRVPSKYVTPVTSLLHSRARRVSDALGGDALGSLMHPAPPRKATLTSAAVESTGFGGVEPTPLGPRGVEWRLPSEGGGACFSAVTSAPLEDTREDVLRSSVRAAAANTGGAGGVLRRQLQQLRGHREGHARLDEDVVVALGYHRLGLPCGVPAAYSACLLRPVWLAVGERRPARRSIQAREALQNRRGVCSS